MSDTAPTRVSTPMPAERPPETTNGRPRPARATPETQTDVQEAVKATANAAARSVKAVVEVAAAFTFRQYLALFARICVILFLIVVFSEIEAEGARELFGEIVSKRLSRSVLLGWLGHYRETRSLDLANALSVILVTLSYIAWELVVYRIVHRPTGESVGERFVMLLPAIGLMALDTVLFAAGVHANTSSSSHVLAGMLALAYDCSLVLISYLMVKLAGRTV